VAFDNPVEHANETLAALDKRIAWLEQFLRERDVDPDEGEV